jgi:hypothetical protein
MKKRTKKEKKKQNKKKNKTKEDTNYVWGTGPGSFVCTEYA